MADEDAESVGGISVSIGANHARLPGDIAAADQIFEQARARWEAPIVLRAQAVQPTQQQVQQQAQRQAAPVRPAPLTVGPGSATRAQAQQGQTALQRAINAELAKTGEIYNGQTGEIESATKATHAQRQAVVAVQQQAAEPTALAIDTKPLQDDLNGILATMREIAAEAQKIAATPVSGGSGGTAPARPGRRKTITPRDIGTTANAAHIYTFDPDVYAEQDRVAEARSARQRELALAANSARQEREQRVPRQRGLTDDQRRAANYLNANPAPQTAFAGVPSVTNVNSPGYKSDEEIERSRAPQRQAVLPPAQRTAATPVDEIERQRRAILRDFNEFGRGRGGGGGLTEEDFARRAQQRIATSESQSAARGRTPNTTASSFGGQFLFGGPARQQAEATAHQAEAEQRLGLARRRLFDPAIFRDAKAFRQARIEETAAENSLADATERVRSLSGPGTALRSLAAVSVAGAAFGLALKGVDFAISTIGPAFDSAIDRASGFSAVSNKVTQSLAQQTIAARGNVNAVLALNETEASLSATSADVINSQIKLTAQVKAGAQAAGATGGLFQAAIGANQQTPQGLLGGYGGLFGGPLFAQQLGGGAGFAETVKSSFGDITGAAADTNRRGAYVPGSVGKFGVQGQTGAPPPEQADQLAALAKDRVALETTYNDAAKRGAALLGASSDSVAHFGHILDDQVKEIAASNLPQELKDLARQSNEGLIGANGDLVLTFKKATDALNQQAVGLSVPDLATLGRANLAQVQQQQRESAASLDAIQSQQAYVRPSEINAVERQTNYQLGTQLPVQQTLSALASPNAPVGTGIVPKDRASVSGDLKEAQQLQDQLNAKYAQGQQIIADTYRPAILQNFGQAAAQDFDAALAAVKATGQQIAAITAGISNEQAAYQAAQYNFQIQIARRTLSDINGLTGRDLLGAGESYLGVLERQNLALSRQGQLLSFALSQRQINFQTALAGFQAPGVTPEERQARIAEAKLEAEYAQKQLNIQKQQFKNQVKIVDISNLRQGADLARQIGLLVQGRKVTIDTAAAEQKLIRLQQLQQQNVAKVSSYLSAVDKLAGQAMGDIQQLEAAAGHALSGLAVSILKQYGILINGLYADLTSRNALGGQSGGQSPDERHAAGGIYNTRGMTQITPRDVVGEASGETVAILAHPRPLGSGGGGTTVVVNFTGDIKANDVGDLDKVTGAVIKALGRQASILGLRGTG